ncbi:MAG: hypothetical protein AB8U25_00335 [Rickettsiales endosymbiont of Dermacentor nuttalli]
MGVGKNGRIKLVSYRVAGVVVYGPGGLELSGDKGLFASGNLTASNFVNHKSVIIDGAVSIPVIRIGKVESEELRVKAKGIKFTEKAVK